MKFLRILTAGILASAAISTASADVTIRITGSSAFRAATSNAIKNSMTGVTYAYNGTSFTGATYQIIKGTMPGVSGVTTVKTNWSGSVAGVRDVVQGNPIGFLPDATTVSSGGTASASTSGLESVAPDVAMSDTFQGSTKYPTTPALVDGVVGIVPFAFVASVSSPSGLTNMTPQLAKAVFKGGFASAALFTGNPADASDQVAGVMVYAIGRDPFSGTRLTAVAESTVGISSTLAQYQPTALSGTAITQINLYPLDAVNAVAAGDNGYSSGGTLADQLRFTTANVEDANNLPGETHPISFVTYLGEGDADRAVNGTGSSVGVSGARYLAYNGVTAFGGLRATPTVSTTSASTTITLTSGTTTGLVVGQAIKGTNIPVDATIAAIPTGTTLTLSAAASATGTGITATITNLLPNNIRNGAYTFWGYEHTMWKTSLTGDKLTGATAIRNQIKNTDYFASGLADDAAMRVSRGTDGATISGKYY